MSIDCTVNNLFTLCENSNEKFNEVMIKIVSRSIRHLDLNVKTLVNVKSTGDIDAFELETMFLRDAQNDTFGKKLDEMYTSKTQHGVVVIASSDSDFKAVSATLPKPALISINYSLPKDDLRVANSEIVDTDAVETLLDFDRVDEWGLSKSVKVSMVFNAAKVDMFEAGLIMKRIKQCLEDPDMIHL